MRLEKFVWDFELFFKSCGAMRILKFSNFWERIWAIFLRLPRTSETSSFFCFKIWNKLYRIISGFDLFHSVKSEYLQKPNLWLNQLFELKKETFRFDEKSNPHFFQFIHKPFSLRFKINLIFINNAEITKTLAFVFFNSSKRWYQKSYFTVKKISGFTAFTNSEIVDFLSKGR